MDWIMVFQLASVIFCVGALALLLLFWRELKSKDEEQELTEGLAGKWRKQLTWVIILGIIGSIFSILTFVSIFI